MSNSPGVAVKWTCPQTHLDDLESSPTWPFGAPLYCGLSRRVSSRPELELSVFVRGWLTASLLRVAAPGRSAPSPPSCKRPDHRLPGHLWPFAAAFPSAQPPHLINSMTHACSTAACLPQCPLLHGGGRRGAPRGPGRGHWCHSLSQMRALGLCDSQRPLGCDHCGLSRCLEVPGHAHTLCRCCRLLLEEQLCEGSLLTGKSPQCFPHQRLCLAQLSGGRWKGTSPRRLAHQLFRSRLTQGRAWVRAPCVAPRALPAVLSQLPSLASAALTCSCLAQGAFGISGA